MKRARDASSSAPAAAAAAAAEAAPPASKAKAEPRDCRPDFTAKSKNGGSHGAAHTATEVGAADRSSEGARFPKRRVALLVGYCGAEYKGMQMNTGVATIEAELERGLFEAGAIAACNYGHLQKVGWNRAARTDKGVSAAAQVVGVKVQFDPSLVAEGQTDEDALRERLNTKLPKDIRALDVVRVTKGFNAKNHCHKREYQYLMPSYLLAPTELVDAAVADGVELHGHLPKDTPAAHGLADWPSDAALASARLTLLKSYRAAPAAVAALRDTWAKYKGTRKYHNFTSKMGAGDMSAQRFILDLKVSDPFTMECEGDKGVASEWVLLTVVGQSFVLHQIRKMVAMAVDIARGAAPDVAMDNAFGNERVNVPIAPGLGLYLHLPYFELYNQKFAQGGDGVGGPAKNALEWREGHGEAEVVARIEKFKRDAILPKIHATEAAETVYMKWLNIMNRFPMSYVPGDFGDRRAAAQGEADSGDEGGDEAAGSAGASAAAASSSSS